jgi:hypothetical protein
VVSQGVTDFCGATVKVSLLRTGGPLLGRIKNGA